MRTEAGVASLRRALQPVLLVAGVLSAGFAAIHCSSSPASATAPPCTCSDGSMCPTDAPSQCAGSDAGRAPDASGPGDDAAEDASAGFINVNGPFCVSYEIMEEFYAALTPQCTCLDEWKQLSDAQLYIEELDYYPGIYANAHLVAACPQLDCCVRQVGDGGPFPSGCRCSAATLDCTNDVNNGASTATSCP
jgi:hypothetical protein